LTNISSVIALNSAHFRDFISPNFLDQTLLTWNDKISHFQRYIIRAITCLDSIEYYEPTIWERIVKDVLTKKRLCNIYFFHSAYTTFKKIKDKNALDEKIGISEVISHLEASF